jgi:transposase
MSTYARRIALDLLRELGIPLPPVIRGGRPHKLTPAQAKLALQRLARGDHQCEVARELGVHRQTLLRLERRFKQSRLK